MMLADCNITVLIFSAASRRQFSIGTQQHLTTVTECSVMRIRKQMVGIRATTASIIVHKSHLIMFASRRCSANLRNQCHRFLLRAPELRGLCLKQAPQVRCTLRCQFSRQARVSPPTLDGHAHIASKLFRCPRHWTTQKFQVIRVIRYTHCARAIVTFKKAISARIGCQNARRVRHKAPNFSEQLVRLDHSRVREYSSGFASRPTCVRRCCFQSLHLQQSECESQMRQFENDKRKLAVI
jgi:hypothetical protein